MDPQILIKALRKCKYDIYIVTHMTQYM